MALIVGLGWFFTNVALSVMELPLKFLLKDQVAYKGRIGLSTQDVALFIAIATFSNYVKPIFGLLTDSVPLFGTRRKGYLLVGLALAGIGYLVLPWSPRQYWPLLVIYAAVYTAVVLVSTVFGGVMVEVGHTYGSTGRLSAQRVGIVRAIPILVGRLGGWLSTIAFYWATGIAAVCHFVLLPVVWFGIRERPATGVNTQVWLDAREQLTRLIHNRTLWISVALIILVIAAPGFETPLLFFQRDQLRFSQPYIGTLKAVQGAGALAGAALYAIICRRYSLKTLLVGSILLHAAATLVYLFYRTETSAFYITALEGMTNILAVLPLYDLAIRVTSQGGEGLGYSVVMACWNFTASFSDVFGSWLNSTWRIHFFGLVWVNAITTIAVLAFIPFLPRVVMEHKEGGGR